MDPIKITNRDFVFFGLQPWDIEIGSNCKNIAKEIAKNNRVLYVNKPLERSMQFKKDLNVSDRNRLRTIKTKQNILEKVDDNIWVLNPPVYYESINWLPHNYIYVWLNKLNTKKIAHVIQNAMNALDFKDVILFNDNDFLKGAFLSDYLKFSKTIFYIRDFLLSQEYFIRHGKHLESHCLKSYNIVLANSLYLKNYASNYNINSFDIGQGCDVSNFIHKPKTIPEDIISIPKPIIGYCGVLFATRLSIPILEEIVQKRTDWNIVLVGPEDEVFQKSTLHQFQNVHFLGLKDPKQLPSYMHAFDLCINPQLLNQMTIGNYPRKIDEYLAAGKPVVATYTEAMEYFSEVCYLAKDATSYIAHIEKALQEDSTLLQNKRVEVASSHTWEASVALLYNSLKLT